MRLQTREILFSIVIICCTLIISYTTICQAINDRKRLYGKQETTVLAITQQSAFGSHPTYLGSPNARYTLVEFADYQCPPCRNADSQLKQLLNKYAGTLRLTFRNLPLSDIHLQAETAAVAAEAARVNGKFWPVHDALFAAQMGLSTTTIQTILHNNRLDSKSFDQQLHTTALAAVSQDVDFAASVGIDSTPSFLLCCPDGRVLHLRRLDQISRYLKQ